MISGKDIWRDLQVGHSLSYFDGSSDILKAKQQKLGGSPAQAIKGNTIKTIVKKMHIEENQK